jgi:hypothetical protein
VVGSAKVRCDPGGAYHSPRRAERTRVPRSARSAALVAALLVGLVVPAAAQAVPGDLDPTFSGDGMQTTDFGASQDIALAMALQTDGNIVAVGDGGPDGDFALARYLGG